VVALHSIPVRTFHYTGATKFIVDFARPVGGLTCVGFIDGNNGNLDVEIQAFQYPVFSKLETFKLACEVQDKGRSLSNDDKIEAAKQLYAIGESSQKEIAERLSVSPSTVSSWLSRTIKEEKERKKEKAFSLWMRCETQEEIAEAVGVPTYHLSVSHMLL
jgi:transposase-like protein